MRSLLISIVLSCTLVFIPAPVAAQVVNAQVDGDTYRATIELPGGLSTELTIRFENAVGLDVGSIGVSAQAVNPLSLSLLNRLPNLNAISLPVEFPVLIQISPPTGSGMAFEGIAEVELYTRNLKYTAGTPLRLFSAPPGGTFRDITERVSGGSYRPRGSTGHFSDFLVVADVRTLNTVINGKFASLSQLLQTHGPAMGVAARNELEQLLATAQWQWNSADPGGAVDTLSAFEDACASAAAAGQIPRVWRSARDLDNVDGSLRAAARTLKFSLNLAVNQL